MRVAFLCLAFLFGWQAECGSVWQDEAALIAHVENSIQKAVDGVSKVNKKALAIHGMSSAKVRHFLNNVCSLPGSSYLEIGSWKGSTLVSALHKNPVKAIAIDNWSQQFYYVPSAREDFYANVDPYLKEGKLTVIERDCFVLSPREVTQTPINIYFFDGEHTYNSQKLAFTHYNEIFADMFIAIVDDWNWTQVQNGTRDAFSQLGYHVVYEKELFCEMNGDASSWWNGLYIAIVKK